MLEVVEGASLGETAAVQPVADIAVAADIAAVAADIAAAGTADAVALVDIVVADIAAALVDVVVVVVGTPLAADFELFLLPPPAASASAIG